MTTIVQGAIFIACVLLFRRGIVGELGEFIRRRKAAAQNNNGS
jgi:branched-chain amino acid transport system permease protein